MSISVCVITFNRPRAIEYSIRRLARLSTVSEIIVVDNASDVSAEFHLRDATPRHVRFIRLKENQGAVARNHGILAATSELVVTLDDDVVGITDDHVRMLENQFSEKDIAAVCFKVIEEGTGRVVNWCHPRPKSAASDIDFETTEISEGAVCLRRDAVVRVGLYPADFFISHEGPDLAFRLIDAGYRVMYQPTIVVEHAVSPVARVSWRRYYFDSRNVIWLAIRNYDLWYGAQRVGRELAGMFVYSVRDGYFRYWVRGILDAIRKSPAVFKERRRPNPETMRKLRDLEAFKPSISMRIRERIFKRGVQI